MSVAAIQAFAEERHVADPADARFDHKMLWSVYSDGELTTQKAGPVCWGRRIEHTIEMGYECRRLDDDGVLPGRIEGTEFTHAILEDGADARKLHQMVVEEIGRRWSKTVDGLV